MPRLGDQSLWRFPCPGDLAAKFWDQSNSGNPGDSSCSSPRAMTDLGQVRSLSIGSSAHLGLASSRKSKMSHNELIAGLRFGLGLPSSSFITSRRVTDLKLCQHLTTRLTSPASLLSLHPGKQKVLSPPSPAPPFFSNDGTEL